MLRRHALVFALTVVMLIAGLPGLSGAGATTGMCGPLGSVSCYTLAEFRGQTLWTLTGLDQRNFQNAIFASATVDLATIRAYLPRVSAPRRYAPPDRPAIFTYVSGKGTGPIGSNWWPATRTAVEELLKHDSAIALVGEGRRILFAASDDKSMSQLVAAALGGVAPPAKTQTVPESPAQVKPISCTAAGASPCYTPSTMNGKTLWEITGLRPEREPQMVAVASSHLNQQLIPTKGVWRPSNRWLRGAHVAQQLAGRPVIFTYALGEDVRDVAPEWPVSEATVRGLLASEPAIAVWSRAKGQPRVLLAAQDWANLDRLVVCAVKGVCPSLYQERATPWDQVVPAAPKWADITVVVDLRKPADNGTALVYLSVPGQAESLFDLAGSTSWRPTALRALFRPEDGARVDAMPDTRVAPRLDARGRLVYEVNPYYEGSQTGSQIYHDLAFIWMAQLIPYLPVRKETPVAVRWLLPEGWSLNAPWAQTDGWYRLTAAETGNAYVSAGKLAYGQFTVDDYRFTVAQLADSPAARREETFAYTRDVLEHLFQRLGPPPTNYEKHFTLTLFDRWLEGGSAGLRTVKSVADPKIIVHELIHWWNGVPYRTDDTWKECTTEYLTVRYLVDAGVWTAAQYDKFMREQQAVKSAYGRASKAENVYAGDALAFARDLDLYIRERSSGKHTLYDVIRYAATGKEQSTPSQIQKLIREATGVDPAPLFQARW